MPSTSDEKGGCGIIPAALLLVAGYALVHLEQVTHSVRALTGGDVTFGASRLRSRSFGEGAGACSLETYWGGGRMHYRATCKLTPEQLRQVGERHKERPGNGVSMAFWLRNRFGQDVVHLEIPAAAFRTDDKDAGRVVAVGSVPVSESDYWEITGSSECRARNSLQE